MFLLSLANFSAALVSTVSLGSSMGNDPSSLGGWFCGLGVGIFVICTEVFGASSLGGWFSR